MEDPTGFDAIVVGSGFGGAVAAARLAQAGLRVAVLERGRRWPPGSFPRNTANLKDGWLWQYERGLYDVRWLDHMVSVQGAGWGGGSLVYANVFARPPAEIFTEHWPGSYTRESLEPYFDLAAHMLDVAPVGRDPATQHYPPRTSATEAAVVAMDRAMGTVRPQLAVRFADDPHTAVTNRHGATQRGCTFVGECVLGCNQGAKNSLDYNYLHVAERHGAQAFTDAEVTGLVPTPEGYSVSYTDHVRRRSMTLTAPAVFLAAGSVGTTELLLRARDAQQTLPGLSDTLGNGFSGNGDFLAFVRRAPGPLATGPTITTTSIVDCTVDGRPVWFQVQDGSYPASLALLVAGLLPRPRIPAGVAARIPPGVAARIAFRRRRRADDAPAAPNNVMALLLMGRDYSGGRLKLDHKNEASVAWKNRANRDLYRIEGRAARTVATQLRGRVSLVPTWRFLRQAITVHNLGGVPMGVDGTTGVINDEGEVHGYPGLYVVDGSAVPGAVGVNPSGTIIAMAERMVEAAIRRRTGDPTWRAPEHRDVTPRPVPEDAAMAAMATYRAERDGYGIAFRERLRGHLQTDRAGDTVAGSRRRAELELTVRIPGWRPFVADAAHRMAIAGTLRLEGVAAAAPVAGTLALFPEHSSEAMRYDVDFVDDAGTPWRLAGTKNQHRRRPLTLWSDLTTLHVTAAGADARLSGQLRISTPDVAALATSLRAEAYTSRQRLTVLARFLAFFGRGALRGVAQPSAAAAYADPGR